MSSQSNPITAGELATLRADTQTLMDQGVEIQRRSITQGATGNVVPTYAHLSTTTCTLSLPSQSMLQNYDFKLATLDAWVVRLPYGTDVRATDHLIVGGAGGKTLEVQDPLTPMSYQASVRVLATVVE